MAGIDIQNLHFRIGDFALSDVSFSVPAGEYFVLTGPNGAGKSLLLKLIVGLLQPDAGTIGLGGVPLTGRPPWQRGIGYVPQDGLLFPHLTVRENVVFGLRVRHWPAPRLAAALDAVATKLDLGPLLGRWPAGLSGGERQRVSLARAIVFQPTVLLLDEPVSALDEEARNRLCQDLRRLQRESRLTVVHVAHSPAEIALVADRVGQLRGGRLTGASAPTAPRP